MSEPMTLEEIIGQAIGEASMCWDPKPSDAVFTSGEAVQILYRVMAAITERLAAKDAQLLEDDNLISNQRVVIDGYRAGLARLESERNELRAQLAQAREIIQEMALSPYQDSDLVSLMRTLNTRAEAYLTKYSEKK